jgi:hypothetical protein
VQECGGAAVAGDWRRGPGFQPGSQDALDGAVGRVPGGDRLGAGRLEAGLAVPGTRPRIPWAERSRRSALTSISASMTCRVAGPVCPAWRRHQAGLRIAKAIFSGG